jgi:lactoylglutathione lyase
VLDPDGYWIEIIARAPSATAPKYSLAQTMLRVKDPAKSVPFYTQQLGMTVVRESHFGDFSLFFLATLPEGTVPPDPTSDQAKPWVNTHLYPNCIPILEVRAPQTDDSFAGWGC